MTKKFQIYFFLICFLQSRYGAGTGTGTVTFQKEEPEPEPFNFSKVGTGTVKNSYGSTTLPEQQPLHVRQLLGGDLVRVA
jgi:hypothetical protein